MKYVSILTQSGDCTIYAYEKILFIGEDLNEVIEETKDKLCGVCASCQPSLQLPDHKIVVDNNPFEYDTEEYDVPQVRLYDLDEEVCYTAKIFQYDETRHID